MNHLIKYQPQKFVPIQDREWVSWTSSVEKTLGHTLVGDLSTCGYSLDRAYDFFIVGAHWTEYVNEIKSRPQYQKLCKR